MATRAARRLVWQGHVEALLSSGLPRAVFCAQRGVSRSALYRWEARLRHESGENRHQAASVRAGFVPLRVRPAAPVVTMTLRIGGGVHLELPRETDAAWLAMLLRGLAGC